MAELLELNERYGIPGVAQVVADHGGLPAVRIGGPGCTGAGGTVYLHGAHVAAWTPHGFEEVLWLSGKSLWQENKAIRGGVPLCFPWFGPRKDHPESPAHGFARVSAWQLASIRQEAAGVTVELVLQSDDASRVLWPYEFILQHRVTFGPQLIMSLELENTGAAPFTAEEAQHTYFSVGDVRRSRITGLDGTRYLDKVDGFKEKVQSGDITISGETDRVYLETTGPVTIDDPVKRRRITVIREHSCDAVVWNPWIAKAKAMADFGDEEWPGMLCVETANVGNDAIALRPGQTHIMTTRISVEPA